jgi:lantibiotic modifying enzyme
MTSRYLDVAHSLGRQLAKTAIWHEDRCNWVGQRSIGDGRARGPAILAALGPDLYGGTSGIALFLAELHAATGDMVVRQTALGAIRQALSRVADGTTNATVGSGLYEGRVGIALAAAQVGVSLRQGHLLDQAAALAASPRPPDRGRGEDPGFDLMSGRAGSVVGLLVLRQLMDDDSLLEKAVGFADDLLATARKDDRWYTWSPAKAVAKRPLTGLPHGAAGVGYALLELAAITGEARYRAAAELAFAYERSLFDATEQNWPDFRQVSGHRSRRTHSFATQWCHGAPGIALSRLRAHHVYNDETCRVEAVAGLATTHKMVGITLSTRRGNYSLCHGLAGNAEVLLQAAEILGSGWAPDRALAIDVAEAGIERFAGPDRPWPCGVHQGVTPNLMVGLAGIGYFYLRLYDPTVPSALLLRPESFKASDAVRNVGVKGSAVQTRVKGSAVQTLSGGRNQRRLTAPPYPG